MRDEPKKSPRIHPWALMLDSLLLQLTEYRCLE